MPRKPQFILTDSLMQAIDRQFKFHGTLHGACHAIGMSKDEYKSVWHAYRKMGDNNPYKAKTTAEAYLARTGETVLSAIADLAPTHTMTEVAELIGYNSKTALQRYLAKQGVSFGFKKRKVPSRPDAANYIKPDAVERYVSLRLDGMRADDAARVVGHHHTALRDRARKQLPEQYGQIVSRQRCKPIEPKCAGAKQA